MSIEELLCRMRRVFDGNANRKRRRNSSCVDSGPPPKLPKNVQEHRFLRDDSIPPVRKPSFLRQMGSILSKFKSHPPICEPNECLEYSDGEDVIIVQKFKRSDPRFQPINNHQFDKMYAVNNKTSASRPPPGLIHKNKWYRVPDLQKMNPARTGQRVNGYHHENDTGISRNILLNGNSLSFKPRNSQNIENIAGRTNYMTAVNNVVGKFPSLNLQQPLRNQSEEKAHFEKLLKSCVPDYGQPSAVPDSLPTSRRQSLVSNHISSRPPIRTSGVHILDDDFHKKQEDATRLFAETSLKSERKVTPVNTMQLKLDSSIVCKKSYPDTVKEKYNLTISQRHEKISQQEERVNQLSSMRLKHCSSYENLAPAWRTPDVVVFDEDIEEKINDFPELTDSQKKIIRDAMNESYSKVLNFKYKITITRRQIETLQWEPLTWLDDDVINFYMGLLQERGEGEGYPKVFAMNTFFTTSLFSRGYSSVRRWTKNVDIFACELILVPIHVGKVHWCMAIINLVEKTIKYYDSMGSPNNRVLDELESYLKQESLAKKNIEFDWSGWDKFNVTDNPRQENGSDCGVFSCMTAEFICRNRPIIFSQQHMIYFRQRMVLEICTGQLLL